MINFNPAPLVRPLGVRYFAALEHLYDRLRDLSHTKVLIAGGKIGFAKQTRLLRRAPQNISRIVNEQGLSSNQNGIRIDHSEFGRHHVCFQETTPPVDGRMEQ